MSASTWATRIATAGAPSARRVIGRPFSAWSGSSSWSTSASVRAAVSAVTAPRVRPVASAISLRALGPVAHDVLEARATGCAAARRRRRGWARGIRSGLARDEVPEVGDVVGHVDRRDRASTGSAGRRWRRRRGCAMRSGSRSGSMLPGRLLLAHELAEHRRATARSARRRTRGPGARGRRPRWRPGRRAARARAPRSCAGSARRTLDAAGRLDVERRRCRLRRACGGSPGRAPPSTRSSAGGRPG